MKLCNIGLKFHLYRGNPYVNLIVEILLVQLILNTFYVSWGWCSEASDFMEKYFPDMWIQIPVNDNIKGKAVFSTRHGGMSNAPYNWLNLSFYKDDCQDNVRGNFKLLSENVDIPLECMVLTKQVHGSRICVVDKSHAGMGILRQRTFGECDGLITADKNVALVTFHADCVPVYLYDINKKVIALVHSGWRSTLQRISSKALKAMKDTFDCKSEDIYAVIGPCIQKCCFEVGREVYKSFLDIFPESTNAFIKRGNKWNIDLVDIIKKTLLDKGLKHSHIQDVNRCTVCEKEYFFSHRGGKGISGTAAAIFMMYE